MTIVGLEQRVKDKNSLAFLHELIEKARENNIKFHLSPNKVLYESGVSCTGSFGVNSGLSVAVGRSVNEWLPVLVHEGCHMDQCLEQCKSWRDVEITGKLDALDIIIDWIDREIELTDDEVKSYIKKSINVEYDCEERSLRKISKYKLPIDKKTYAQKANAYLMFYYMVEHFRAWRYAKLAPYSYKNIWERMPMKLMSRKMIRESAILWYELYKPIMKIRKEK